ncbi:MAG: biopolymer transporter ExbD [Longimicrobiales bacterium]
MGVSMGNTGRGSVSDINMTPMIDVLLVLLVIFIIAQPMMQKTIDMQVPKKEKATATSAPIIILEIHKGGKYAINTIPLDNTNIEAKIREIFANRDGQRLLFIKPDQDVTFEEVIYAMDRAKGGGIEVMATVLNE